MRNLLLVGCGGFLGSIARYALSGIVLHTTAATRFPWATLVVNTSGCLGIGVLAGLGEHFHLLSPGARLLLITGFLGGFTTYSAFAYETYFLGREQLWMAAAANMALHLLLGMLGVWLGQRVVALCA